MRTEYSGKVKKGKKNRGQRERNEWGPMDFALAFGTITVILEGN